MKNKPLLLKAETDKLSFVLSIENLTLGDVILDDDDDMLPQDDLALEEMDDDGDDDDPRDRRRDNLLAADRFVLQAIKACTQLTALHLHMSQITDTAGMYSVSNMILF